MSFIEYKYLKFRSLLPCRPVQHCPVYPAMSFLFILLVSFLDASGQNNTLVIDTSKLNTLPATPSSGHNYIRTITYREAHTTVPTGSFSHSEEIQYFDGLGRPVQSIQVGASPSIKDIIQPVLYDAFGREATRTLPYVSGSRSGTYNAGFTESTVSNYYSSGSLQGKEPDTRAFTLTTFDNSPLNRIVSQAGSGAGWENKPVRTNYLTNTAPVKGWIVTDETISAFDYPPASLYITGTVDEDGNATREYKDKLGQVVMKESKLGDEWLRTAYIYDDFGLLRCVVPPAADSPADSGLCYYYKYDHRRRMTEKKIPGAGTFTMVYDRRDRLRLSQSALQAETGEWSFTKYDALNRPVITGTIRIKNSRAHELTAALNALPLNEKRDNDRENGYDNASYPSSGGEVLTVTWYDDHSFLDINSRLGSLASEGYDGGEYDIRSELAASDKGRVTGSMTRILSAPADKDAVKQDRLYSAVYYDKYANVLRTVSENHRGGKDVLTNVYEPVTWLLVRSRQEHYSGEEKVIIEKRLEYDHEGRILATTQKVNDQPEITLSAMKYNETGELISKYLHSEQTAGSRSFLQKTDYSYNIRGWLTKINDPGLGSDNDLFGMQLYYNKPFDESGAGPGKAVFNGNISAIRWGTSGDMIKGYRFSYDGLSRMLLADYGEGIEMKEKQGSYSEEVTGYDKNGNIAGLKRKYDNLLVDDLAYEYFGSGKSNQLLRITDAGVTSGEVEDYPGTSVDYRYDSGGNMTKDGSKNLYIDYHSTLNLPRQLDFGYDNRVFYHYTAGGAKLIKNVRTGIGTDNRTDYIGNIVYENGTLSYIITDEGRLVAESTPSGRRFINEYNLKDHLGNTRVTFIAGDGGALTIAQATNYYPFGLVMNQFNGNTGTDYRKNKYLYNGKELHDDSFGGSSLNWFDYGWRFYDPTIARWHVPDPRAEKYRRWSPYNYVFNNPLSNIDPNGDTVFVQVTNKVVGTTDINLFSSSEVTAGTIQETKEVNVYEVNVTNESGSSATFYYTRDGYRKDAANPAAEAEDVTFDVRNDGDSFQGQIKSRWGETDNVLELRKFDDVNNQSVDAMKGGSDATRTAIQFHLKGATDGCLMSVGSDQFKTTTEGMQINNTNLSTTSSGSQINFMNKVKDFRTADSDAGKSNFIKISFQKN